jgi:Flp pilus assembly protein TadB
VSDKPTPRSLSSNYLNAALAILVGSIAVYLTVQLLRSIAVPLIVASVVLTAVWTLRTLRRLRRPSDW